MSLTDYLSLGCRSSLGSDCGHVVSSRSEQASLRAPGLIPPLHVLLMRKRQVPRILGYSFVGVALAMCGADSQMLFGAGQRRSQDQMAWSPGYRDDELAALAPLSASVPLH